MTRSWKTTAGGAAAALGVLLAFVLPQLGVEITDGKADEIAGAVVLLVGLLMQGVSARDDNVTSEGRKAPKAIKP